MWKTTIRGLAAHKVRLALTALAVVLGVGFISGTYVLTDTMNKAFTNLFSNVTEGVDLILRTENSFVGIEGEEDRRRRVRYPRGTRAQRTAGRPHRRGDGPRP